MAFGVFIHRSDSIYDDSPAEQYQFPSQYLNRAKACAGDWIIYYEPRKVTSTRGYFAVAKVQTVLPDPKVSNMYLAVIEAGSYLDFASPVPFKGPDGVVERSLLNETGALSGKAQSAVRTISPADFNRIVELGLAVDDDLLPRIEDNLSGPGLQELQAPFQYEQERNQVEFLSVRKVRDSVFRRTILRAYDERCAITGLKLINGGGRAEVEAAHIRPVEKKGPDIVNNGIALSGTAHWMFDRGLISLENDLRILVSRQVNDPETVFSLINQNGYLTPPHRAADCPHPNFLSWHRDNCFKH